MPNAESDPWLYSAALAVLLTTDNPVGALREFVAHREAEALQRAADEMAVEFAGRILGVIPAANWLRARAQMCAIPPAKDRP